MIPQWNREGEPENLAAAAKDAGEWLVALKEWREVRLYMSQNPDAKARLERCIERLHHFTEEAKQSPT